MKEDIRGENIEGKGTSRWGNAALWEPEESSLTRDCGNGGGAGVTEPEISVPVVTEPKPGVVLRGTGMSKGTGCEAERCPHTI